MGFYQQKKKGCIFFFKHTKMTPIRIGMSSQPYPDKQFKELSREAPYGCEMIGSIGTFYPRLVMTRLHTEFNKSRLNGDWFAVDLKDLTDAALKLTENEAAPILYKKNGDESTAMKGGRKRMTHVESAVWAAYTINKRFSRNKLAEKLGVTRQTIHRKLKEVQKTHGAK